MEISGPFLNHAKRRARNPSCWYLSYTVPKLNPDGTVQLNANGRPVLERHRPFYLTKKKAKADKPRIRDQHTTTGTGEALLNRKAADEYSAAKKVVGDVSLVDVAKFWRRHHPETKRETLRELFKRYIKSTRRLYGMADEDEAEDAKSQLAKKQAVSLPAVEEPEDAKPVREPRHLADLRSRVGAFVTTAFGDRQPQAIEKKEIIDYLRGLPTTSARTRRNHKNALSAFFGWICDEQLLSASPVAQIRRRVLGIEKPNDIRFLSLEQATRYLRAAERYAPDLVAHEVVQLISGVRSDEEMADFRAEFVMPRTKHIVVPAAVGKMNERDIIEGLENNFWAWWAAYGPKEGLLRPKYYGPKWDRLRVLASVEDQAQADRLARLPVKHLLRMPSSKLALEKWPWNGRRRTFCTFHVAKHQSADRTALILRHHGDISTLHNSYRGRGLTQEDGIEYFNLMPQPVASPILPERMLKGIVAQQSRQVTPAGG